MRQFELYAVITQPIALMPIAAYQASGRFVSASQSETKHGQIRHRHNH